ncbi:urea amidolyase associated protein UAAP2 [Citricoccus sp. GCM10030269]|uniref:urea amidolyase associated protein UAAP2 n=1 Tax=Citricoccus sp. GCM10030269 TaxID=3273388 RepID=UPI003611273E
MSTMTDPASTTSAPSASVASAPFTAEPAVLGTELRREPVAPRAPWSARIPAGQVLTIVDLDGNQAVDFLAYDAEDTARAYSVQATLQGQDSVYLTAGSVLRTHEYDPLMTVVATDVERHDTLGGACSKESNTLRYGHHTWSQHGCADNFLAELSKYGMGKRDQVSNVNWFMNVPVDPDGALGIVDGISAPGLSVSLRAERDTLVIVSNCPQINNPCNGFNPSRTEMIISAGATDTQKQEG